ncbi:CDP-glucose 4,6-dehydratase [Alsobacter sp. R-9]
MSRAPDPQAWRGRSVLVTGHTGFKGSWLALLLARLGAQVHGVALEPPPGPSLFALAGVRDRLASHRILDIRDGAALSAAVTEADPEVVFHLAAQALVGVSYRDPAGTFATNVDGTIHLMQALRGRAGCAAALVVTSDKVYRNDGSGRPFREDDPLGGHDPYSASKAACEIAVASWASSFGGELPRIATARAGNVIGGGDFAEDRLIPDLVRADRAGRPLLIRRPDATRPFQHVLDVLLGYVLFAEDLMDRPDAPTALNFGPSEPETSVRDLLRRYGAARGRPVAWEPVPGPVYGEAPRLALDATLARQRLRWQPRLAGDGAVGATAAWYEAWAGGADVARLTHDQIAAVLS